MWVGNEGRRESRMGNVAMVLSLSCEMHEIGSPYVNKIILKYH